MSVTLRPIDESDLELIMKWRMDPDITRYMNTDPKLTIDGQKKWLEAIEEDDTVMHWLIEVEQRPAGIICLINIDWQSRKASWGYYIGEKECRSLKVAISLEMSLYDFVFEQLGFDRLDNEVFALNEGVVKLHLACGSRIEKTIAEEVHKNGVAYDIVHITISRQEWDEIKKKKKYEHICFEPALHIHHIGYAVESIEKSEKQFFRLGYRKSSSVCEDTLRNIKILFLKNISSGEIVELVEPMEGKNPVSGQLEKMKGVTSPYHICYEVRNIQEAVQWLKQRKYIVISKVAPAPAICGRQVVFLLHKDAGMIELVEEEGDGKKVE